jgi:tetratricopeptide (TPR) repeat protein
MSPSPAPPQPASTPDTAPPGRTARLLKIVAGITAVLSLALAGRQVAVFVTDYRARQLRVRDLVAASALQRRAGEHAAAWATLTQALKVDPDNAAVRAARVDAAEAWLETGRPGGTAPTFTALADTLSPVLTEALLHADPVREADLLAHLGWADFLRWREGGRDLSPPARYREALVLDSLNPFAHAMLGHWLLWQGEDLRLAQDHFTRALASGRARDYVRRMQLAGLANRDGPDIAAEMLRVATAMQEAHEPLPDGARDRLWRAFSDLVVPSGSDAPALVRVAPAELLKTYRWLFDGSGYSTAQSARYDYQLATLQAAAGDTAGALATGRRALARSGTAEGLRPRLTALVARLEGKR